MLSVGRKGCRCAQRKEKNVKPSRSRNGTVNPLLNLNRREFTLCGVLTSAAWVKNDDRATCGRCLSKLESFATVRRRAEPVEPVERTIEPGVDPYANGGRLAFAADYRRTRYAMGPRRLTPSVGD